MPYIIPYRSTECLYYKPISTDILPVYISIIYYTSILSTSKDCTLISAHNIFVAEVSVQPSVSYSSEVHVTITALIIELKYEVF